MSQKEIWSWGKCQAVSIKLGFFAILITTAWWFVWGWFAPVPFIEPIFNLPFVTSRMVSDVFFVPAWVMLFTVIFGRYSRPTEDFIVFMFLGFAGGIFFYFKFDPVSVFFIAVATGAIIGLILGLECDPAMWLVLIFGTGAGIAFGFFDGLIIAFGGVSSFIFGVAQRVWLGCLFGHLAKKVKTLALWVTKQE